MQRPAGRGLGCRRAGHRQDHADRALRGEPRRRRLSRAASAWSTTAPASPICPCSKRWPSCAAATRDAAGVAARRGADLAAAAAVAQHARRSATRCGASSPASGPDRMLREMGELLDRYTEQRPLLLVTEDLHWSDRATIQLIDYVARRRGRARPDVAGELPPRRGGGAGPSAQPVAARAAPAPAVRGDRARPVLRDRGRRLRRGTLAIARARRGVRACAARAHRRRAAVRLVGHDRSDGRARARRRRRWRPRRSWRMSRFPRTWRPSSITTSPGSAASSARCSRRPRSAASSSASIRFRAALERDVASVARPATSWCASRCGSTRAACRGRRRCVRAAVLVQACAVPPGAVRPQPRRRRARSCTARSARPSNGSARPACRSPPRSWRCTSTAAGSR